MNSEHSALPADEEQTQTSVDATGIDGAASILEQLLLDAEYPIDRGISPS